MNTEAQPPSQKETKVCRYCHRDIPKGARKCPECHSDQRSVFARHPIITILLILIILPAIIRPFVHSKPPDLTRCLQVPERAVEALSEGIEKGITVRGAQAVKSATLSNGKEIYFVAVDLQGEGINDTVDVALFATRSGIEDDNTVGFISVDALAIEFSDWGPSAGTKLEIDNSQDGASLAEECVRHNLGG